MKKTLGIMIAVAVVGSTPTGTEQVWTGTVSDARCGASHQAVAKGLSNRECIFACVEGLKEYVLVMEGGQVLRITNQDLQGLPLYAGRPVRMTGELKGDAILATKVEAIAAHLHLGHVMTNW